MTRTDRGRFPVLFAAITALALAGDALALIFSTVQAQEMSAPAAPTGLTSEVSQDSVILSWDDSGDDTITGYVILRRDKDIHEEGTFETIEADTGSADTTYTDDSAQPERQ